ncbi:hypothetical protein [Xenorhabdus sp. KK7.4]|nr:hypothetical protein [Xenorhabdus sp. KK7.4]
MGENIILVDIVLISTFTDFEDGSFEGDSFKGNNFKDNSIQN